MPRITVKEKVLSILNSHRGSYYSGQALAEELGVSRTAVWKAIENLRKEGYSITGSTNVGYALAEETDLLDAASIEAMLTPQAKAFYQLQCEESVTSTNDLVRTMGSRGNAEGTCMIAAEQTAGKGRRGRSFYSPESTGLYLSILLRPNLSFEDAVQITTLAAVAGAKAAEAINPRAKIDIKWVNDLYLNGKKFCGILTEADLSMESGKLNFAVMGIGFNITSPTLGWPLEIKDHVTGILEGKPPVGTRNELAAAFLNEFLPIYQALPELTYLEEYRKRLLWVNHEIRVLNANGTEERAILLGVNERCELLVKYLGSGEEAVLNSGEISIRG